MQLAFYSCAAQAAGSYRPGGFAYGALIGGLADREESHDDSFAVFFYS